MLEIPEPQPEHHSLYFESYISRMRGIKLSDSIATINKYYDYIDSRLQAEEAYDYRYAPGKWSAAEVLQHVNDTAMILSCRALKLARGEDKQLLPYDEDLYGKNMHIPYPSILKSGFQVQISQINTMSFTIHPDAWLWKGWVNGEVSTAASNYYMIFGHAEHHLRVIEEKYLRE